MLLPSSSLPNILPDVRLRAAASRHAILAVRQLGGRRIGKLVERAEQAGVDLAALRTGRIKDAFLPIAGRVSPYLAQYLRRGRLDNIFPLPQFDELLKTWTPPTGTTLLTLGQYVFSIGTAAQQSIERTTAWRWASLDRLHAMPVLQNMGQNTEKINITGTILPHFAGGWEQVNAMRQQGHAGNPLPLVTPDGAVLGHWVIREVKETGGSYDAAGRPLKIDFMLTLESYPDDALINDLLPNLPSEDEESDFDAAATTATNGEGE